MKRGGQARWNDETQSWEDGTPPPAPYTGPMPPRPAFAPSAGGTPTGAVPRPATEPPSAASPPATDPPPAPGPPFGPARGTDPHSAVPEPAADWFHDPGTYDPGTYAEPVTGVRRRSTGLVAGAAVAVIAAAVGGGYLLWGHSGDDPAAARPAARTKTSAADHTTTAAPTGATATTSPGPLSTEIPSGYRLVHDTKGFTLAVPRPWKRSERRTGVFYTSPDDRRLVQIFEISEPDTTPYEALETASRGLSGNPGYKEISLGPLGFPGPGTDATQLVYAYDSERLGERVKVVDCAFTVGDGRQFAVLVLGPEADWPDQEWMQQNMLRSFVPGS
ncbi:hypothetical protein [Streptomyces angustmyceticus]|uniref:hypothetical protein n=1 Tax=Streptomyces angustmyceticus TaxID=285578 RepID=UPI00344B713B